MLAASDQIIMGTLDKLAQEKTPETA